MKRIALSSIAFLTALLVLITAAVLPTLAYWQSTGVTAEAVGQANLRANPDVASDLVGQITAGTRYPVLGQSEFFPWLLLGDPATAQPIGWVFAELVTVQGNVSQVPLSTLVVDPSSVAAPEVATSPAAEGSVPDSGPPALSPTPDAPATPTLAAAVVGTVLGEINVRYGPGVEYPRLGIGRAGDQFEIVGRHTQLPWVEIRYPTAPDGLGWVLLELLEVQGDVNSLPSTSRTQFNLPSLTPTQSVVHASTVVGATPVAISPEFQVLGDRLWQQMLEAQFETGTSRLGALFLMNLQTGEAVSFGDDIAFSGMSLSKIAILTTLYGMIDAPADPELAGTIAESMICSENISTNEILSAIGGGSPFEGARQVTTMLQTLGLQDTFLTAPYANDPFITPEPVSGEITTADQVSAEPDPFNQVTVDDLGGLLNSVYQCAYNETGPLLTNFPDQYTPTECRQILNAMSNNKIDALFESGVPPDTRVAHKHGWIDDTHGDAAVIFTPGGNYIMVAIVHNPTWMDFGESFPLLGEMSRTVYNYFNPQTPYEEVREGIGAEQCELLGNPLLEQLQSSVLDS